MPSTLLIHPTRTGAGAVATEVTGATTDVASRAEARCRYGPMV